MLNRVRRSLAWGCGAWLLLIAATVYAQAPSPNTQFGFAIGDDYRLANYDQTEAYFRKVAASSDRFRLVEMGETSEGRSQWMLIASAPENLAQLDHYRDISEQLARARVDANAAEQLASIGKPVVWIDGGLHANETVGAHQLIETVWQLASRQDAETKRILKDVIILLVHANPDGQQLYSDWYMREPVPEKRKLDTPPRMYQKYAGHDNNRDFYMAALQETQNMNRVMYTQWYPQIVYNHHQAAPKGTVIVLPPYRDPYNYNINAMIPVELEAIGSAMNLRFLQEGKAGAVSKRGSVYSTWWNGGLRTMPYFHNMLGILTEIVGNPTPMEMPFLVSRQLPDSNLPAPVAPQLWHFKQSIDYSLAANWAVLDYASRNSQQLLLNAYRMGRDAIERGQRDSWTPSPSALKQVQKALAEKAEKNAEKKVDEVSAAQLHALLYRQERRDPRGYILSADQPDFSTAVKFINALQLAGIEVQRARAAFSVAGKRYPVGSYIVRADQAFRPHVLDMFEPQDHPNDFAYVGGPPIAPYDSAGWTLALQMGVQFDRIRDAFSGPFEPVPVGEIQQPPRSVLPKATQGYVLDARSNDSVLLVNRLLKAGVAVRRQSNAPGNYIIPQSAEGVLAQTLEGVGVELQAAPRSVGDTEVVRAPRIALWDHYGGSIVSGWTRLVLESFGFAYDVLYPKQIDQPDLRKRYDVLILPSGALPLPESLAVAGKAGRKAKSQDAATIPAQYQFMLGELDNQDTLPALRAFLEQGGHIVATGSSSGLATLLGLPVQSHLRVSDGKGQLRALSDREYYIPGSVLQVAVNTELPVAFGLPKQLDLYFSDGRWDNAPVFDLPKERADIKPILWFDNATPLRSGWAWGQQYLQNGVLAAQARIGNGRLTFFGTDITFRAQAHGAFKLLFNSLMQGGQNDAVAAQ